MPLFGHQNTRGDLFIEYNVVLPVEVSSEMRLSECSLNYLGHSPIYRCISPELMDVFQTPSSTHDEL